MNRNTLFYLFLLLIVSSISACGFLYDVTQKKEIDCYTLPKTQQDECKEQTRTYQEYEEARKKEIKD